MNFLHRNKKVVNAGAFTESAYEVLNYEQLLKVNGAGGGSGGSGGGGGSSGPSSSSGSSSSSSGYGSCGGGSTSGGSSSSSSSGYSSCGGGTTSSSGGNSNLPSPLQTPDNPNKEHCDIYAYNLAVENGIANSGDWDGNSLTVNQIYNGFYSGSSKETNNIEGTAGYVFYDWTGDGTYDHMEYYECSGNGNYSTWQTDGVSTPTEVQSNFSEDSNGHAKNGGNGIVKWVPLG